MRRELVAAALGGIVALGAGVVVRGERAAAQVRENGSERSTITAGGTATVYVKPDSARLFFGLQTLAPRVADARSQNGARMAKVRAAITALGIPGLKTKSSDLSVEPVYASAGAGAAGKLTGFRVSHTFTVLVKNDDPDGLSETAGRLLDTATEAGVNQVEGISFFREDTAEARRNALSLAVRDGLANARALASGAGQAIGPAVQIQGSPAYEAAQSMMTNTIQRAGEGQSSLVAGDQAVTCSVSVICSMKS